MLDIFQWNTRLVLSSDQSQACLATVLWHLCIKLNTTTVEMSVSGCTTCITHMHNSGFVSRAGALGRVETAGFSLCGETCEQLLSICSPTTNTLNLSNDKVWHLKTSLHLIPLLLGMKDLQSKNKLPDTTFLSSKRHTNQILHRTQKICFYYFSINTLKYSCLTLFLIPEYTTTHHLSCF